VIFVSVASKGFSQAVSLLFATLARRPISVAAKGPKAMVGGNPDRAGAGPRTEVRGWGEELWNVTRRLYSGEVHIQGVNFARPGVAQEQRRIVGGQTGPIPENV
jgi:hypothetical protein